MACRLAAVAWDREFFYDTYPRVEEAFAARLDTSLAPRDPSVLLQVVRELDLRPDSRVLDVGCGEGGHAFRLATHFGFRVLGLDPVQRHLDLAREARAGPAPRGGVAGVVRAGLRDGDPGTGRVGRAGLVPRRDGARARPGRGLRRVRPRAAPRRLRRGLPDGGHPAPGPGRGGLALRRDGGGAELGGPGRPRRRDRALGAATSSTPSTCPASGASGRRRTPAGPAARCCTWPGSGATPSATAPSSATRRTT